MFFTSSAWCRVFFFCFRIPSHNTSRVVKSEKNHRREGKYKKPTMKYKNKLLLFGDFVDCKSLIARRRQFTRALSTPTLLQFLTRRLKTGHWRGGDSFAMITPLMGTFQKNICIICKSLPAFATAVDNIKIMY